MDGEPVPGTFAAEEELFALGHALRDAGSGVFELAPAGADGQGLVEARKEVDWMGRLSAATGRPITFALLQNNAEPNLWRELMEESTAACERGAKLYPQVAARQAGVMIGLQTHYAFGKRPTYVELKRAVSRPSRRWSPSSASPRSKARILGRDGSPSESR